LYIDLSRFTEKPIQKIRELFKYWQDKAMWHQPSLLLFDNIDKLMGVEVEVGYWHLQTVTCIRPTSVLKHADSFRTRHITETFIRMYSAAARTAAPNMRGIVVIATAQSQAAVHPLLKTLHIFSETVNVLPPNKDARRDVSGPLVLSRVHVTHLHVYVKILTTFVASRLDASDIIKDDTVNFAALATQTEGYAAMDLEDLVARAVHQSAIRASPMSHSRDVRVSVTCTSLAISVVEFSAAYSNRWRFYFCSSGFRPPFAARRQVAKV
jgi:peroxin-1